MTIYRIVPIVLVLACAASPPAAAPAYAAYAPPPPVPVSIAPPPPVPIVAMAPGVPSDVLMRGPVHEAFAELTMLNPTAGPVVTVQPPASIAEVPPDMRPAVADIAWIPGYWAWDDERSAFIWVSGVWRNPPPGCSWVPGYWTVMATGWQWTPGFWLPGGEEIVYLPAPPASRETGPIGVAPSDDVVWIPGCWIWQGGQYLWRSGFWAAGQASWVWSPAHYIWTPRGGIFIEGYWDHPIESRGVLFAPVVFQAPICTQPGFYYSPLVVINTDVLMMELFARPGYCHYYFGDYYDPMYARAGILPWYAFRDRHDWDDELFRHELWRHRRDDPRWDVHERESFDRRVSEPTARPPRTFAALQLEVKNHPDRIRQIGVAAQPLAEMAANKAATMKFEKLQPQDREQLGNHVTNVHTYGQQRAQWEGPGAAAPGKAGPTIVTPPVKGPPGVTAPPTKGTPDIIRPPVKGPPEATAPPTKGTPDIIRPPVKGPPDVTAPPVKGLPPTFTSPTKGGPETVGPTEPRKPIVEPEHVQIPPSPVRGKPLPPPHPVAPPVESPRMIAPRPDDSRGVGPAGGPPRMDTMPPDRGMPRGGMDPR
jgi:hypothetical protein